METEAKRRKTTPSESTIFKPRRDFHLNTTEVHLVRPLKSLFPAASPWIFKPASPWIVTIARNSASPTTNQYRHPLTGNLLNLPANFDLRRFSFYRISESKYVSYANASFDKLLVYPYSAIPNPKSYKHTFLALYNGGQLLGCPAATDKWIRVNVDGRHGFRLYDDLIMFKERIYVVDIDGKLSIVTCGDTEITMCKPVINRPVDSWSRRRNRLVADKRQMYLVVSLEGEECDTKELFRVYKRKGKLGGKNWEEVKGFEGGQVLFISRDSYFFIRDGISLFPGDEYKHCIVFSKDAFAFRTRTEGGCENEEDENEEDSIAIFRLSDGTFVKDGENEGFRKINWEPPAWVFDAVSGSAESTSRLQSEPDSDQGLMDGKLQSGLNDSDSKDKKDEETRSNTNVQGCASLQRELSSSLPAGEEVMRTLLRMTGENVSTEQETPKKNITQSVPRACTSSTTKSHTSDSTTAKFEGFDIRCDLVPTLQKIWKKYGNILENSIIRSGDIIGRALESLATMVRILEDNSAHSLSSSEADYLTSTMSDLKCICFKVCWLIPVVDKAVQLQQSKHLLDSLKNLNQLSTQVKERRAILFEELTKLGKEENKLKEDMAMLSKKIPFSGQVKFDEPLGIGLT